MYMWDPVLYKCAAIALTSFLCHFPLFHVVMNSYWIVQCVVAMDSDAGEMPRSRDKFTFENVDGSLNLWDPVRPNSLNTAKPGLECRTEDVLTSFRFFAVRPRELCRAKRSMSVNPIISWTVVRCCTNIDPAISKTWCAPPRGRRDHPRRCDVTTWEV